MNYEIVFILYTVSTSKSMKLLYHFYSGRSFCDYVERSFSNLIKGHFLILYKSLFWPELTEIISWPCTGVIFQPCTYSAVGHFLTLHKQKTFSNLAKRFFSDLFHKGFLDDFNWLLIPLTAFSVVLGHIAVVRSREPPASLIYNDGSRSFLW